jgi:hypothetical protein
VDVWIGALLRRAGYLFLRVGSIQHVLDAARCFRVYAELGVSGSDPFRRLGSDLRHPQPLGDKSTAPGGPASLWLDRPLQGLGQKLVERYGHAYSDMCWAGGITSRSPAVGEDRVMSPSANPACVRGCELQCRGVLLIPVALDPAAFG